MNAIKETKCLKRKGKHFKLMARHLKEDSEKARWDKLSNQLCNDGSKKFTLIGHSR
jgi:hypothetical protein